VAQFLAGLGFDNVLVKLGLAKNADQAVRRPSQVVGWLVMVGVILAAALSAFTWLRLDPLAQLLSGFIIFAWQIIMGLLIFGVGLWIATWVAKFIVDSGWPHKYLLALVARIGVIVLSLAMALSAMGLADSIITLAFGVPLVGVALAIGLAFGLGGKEVAGKQLEQWQSSMKDVDEKLAAQLPEPQQPDQPQS
jgi:hypothetical protein